MRHHCNSTVVFKPDLTTVTLPAIPCCIEIPTFNYYGQLNPCAFHFTLFLSVFRAGCNARSHHCFSDTMIRTYKTDCN
jgi:hypothetical protein